MMRFTSIMGGVLPGVFLGPDHRDGVAASGASTDASSMLAPKLNPPPAVEGPTTPFVTGPTAFFATAPHLNTFVSDTAVDRVCVNDTVLAITKDLTSPAINSRVDFLRRQSEAIRKIFGLPLLDDETVFHEVILELVVRHMTTNAVRNAVERRAVIVELIHKFHPDKTVAKDDTSNSEWGAKVCIFFIKLYQDREFLEGSSSAQTTHSAFEIDEKLKPQLTHFEHAAVALAGQSVFTWEDFAPFLKSDCYNKDNGRISGLIESLDSFDTEPMSLSDKERLLAAVVREFVRISGAPHATPPTISLRSRPTETTQLMRDEAVFFPEENTLAIYEPSKPLSAVLAFLFRNSNLDRIVNPDLRKVCEYTQKYIESGLGLPRNLVEHFVECLKAVPAVTLLSDDALRNLTLETRLVRMEELCGKEYGWPDDRVLLKEADFFQAARLLESMPSDPEFDRICSEAGTLFARTNPIEKVRDWKNLTPPAQAAALEAVLDDLDKCFAACASDDAKFIFEKGNRPDIHYVEPYKGTYNYQDGQEKHGGRNVAIQHFPMVSRSRLGRPYPVTEWSELRGKDVTYMGATFIDWTEPDLHHPLGEILRFPRKSDHPTLEEFREKGHKDAYARWSWNNHFKDSKYGQNDNPDNPFWTAQYPSDVVREVVRLYFYSLYWHRIPRLLSRLPPTAVQSLHDFVRRRNLRNDSRDTKDLAYTAYVYNLTYQADDKGAHARGGRGPISPEVLARLRENVPAQKWETSLLRELKLGDQKTLEVCQLWGQEFLDRDDVVRRDMGHVRAYFQRASELTSLDPIDVLNATLAGLDIRTKILLRLQAFDRSDGSDLSYPNNELRNYYISTLNKESLDASDLEELEAAHWLHHEGSREDGITLDSLIYLIEKIIRGEKRATDVKANLREECRMEEDRRQRLKIEFKRALDQIPAEFSRPAKVTDATMPDDENGMNMDPHTYRRPTDQRKQNNSLQGFLHDSPWYLHQQGEKHIAGH